jgi:flagellar hook-associated protein 1 FlgK
VDPDLAKTSLDVSVAGDKVIITDGRSGKTLASQNLSGGVQTITVSGYVIRVSGSQKGASARFQVSGGDDTRGAALSMGVNNLDPEDLAAGQSPVREGQNQGDNKNAHLLFGLLQDRLHFAGGEQPVTFHDFFATGVSEIGSWARNARDHYVAQSMIQKGLENQRMSVSGVSIANESARIIQFEKAYQASANLIHMTNRLLDTLVRLPNESS